MHLHCPVVLFYVNTGLLDKLSNDDELRFVIGHEIAHVDLGHCVKAFNYAFRVGQLTYGVGETLLLLRISICSLIFRRPRI